MRKSTAEKWMSCEVARLSWEEPLFSAKVEVERASNRRLALREALLSMWKVDIHQALRMCQDRQVEVNASGASYVSLDSIDDQ